jgi:signal transduction histidine kinase
MADARAVRLSAAADATAGEPVATLGARSDLRRALVNLVANAIAHTPSGGSVDLTTRRTGDRVEIAVADDGYGVDEASRASLFQRFANGSSAAGPGLGLYIVRRIAEETGGSVRYEPREPRGSLFVLALPAAGA